MSINYLPPVRHILPLGAIRRERRLPVAGSILVRLNERVRAMDVIAEAEPGPRHYYLDISRGLGIPVHEVGHTLVCQRGDVLDAGDIIAGPVGIARRAVRAPRDGRIAAISGGRVLFEARQEPYELRAGFPGEVVGTDGMMSVTIQTTGALIQAAWGNNRQEYGVMRMVGEAGSRLHTDHLDIHLRGAILAAGICDRPEPLHRASRLSIRGLILGSMASSLIPIVRQLPFPVIVVEGFGGLPINTPTYDLLRTNDGREVALDARPSTPYDNQRPEVIIPLPTKGQLDIPDDLVILKPGTRVRVLRAPHHGLVGLVTRISPKAIELPSGILAKCVLVDLEKVGAATVPIANLEILQ